MVERNSSAPISAAGLELEGGGGGHAPDGDDVEHGPRWNDPCRDGVPRPQPKSASESPEFHPVTVDTALGPITIITSEEEES
jgi:hypothetical protein